MRGNITAQRKGRIEVDLDDVVEVAVWELFRGVTSLDTGAVDENADLVAVGEDARDEGGNVGGGGEVGGVEVRFAVEGFNGGLGGLIGGVALGVDVSVGSLFLYKFSLSLSLWE